tara:strand:+ start:2252 stop:2761 length:510 start_codon:yes stop_codon:yes gene_type:complete
MNADTIIDAIIRREGGYVDHPADRGGPTNHGITQQTLAEWRGHSVSADDVRRLSRDEAREIYAERYFTAPKFDHIEHPPLAALVVDCGVNHGPGRAARWLQHAASVTADGVLGPITLGAVNAADGAALYRRVLAKRARFYGRLITGNPSQGAFAAGWANRLSEFIEEAP